MDYLRPRQAYHRARSGDSIVREDIEIVEMQPVSNSKEESTTSLMTATNVESNKRTASTPASTLKMRTTTKWFSGWRTGAYIAALLTLISLCINVAALTWLNAHPDADSQLVEVFKGSCSKVSQLDLWVHLAINAISTLMLSGSNYCMQCLSAPNRKEIDQAHAKGKFIDIGVPSVRNLYFIARWKAVMWWILGLSSLPLHLLYNSAFYSSITSNNYGVFVVGQKFLNGSEIGDLTNVKPDTFLNEFTILANELQQQVLHNRSAAFVQLEPLDCIRSYGTVFLQEYTNLIMVAKNDTNSSAPTVLHTEVYEYSSAIDSRVQHYHPFDWICISDPGIESKINVPKANAGGVDTAPCDTYVNQIEGIVDNWEPWGIPIDYCLAERAQPRCSFNGNIPIIEVVIVVNAVKIIMMLIVAIGLSDSPLITLGDAIESFLKIRDECSKGLCLMSRIFAEMPVSRNVWAPPNGSWLSMFTLDQKRKLQIAETEKKLWHSAASTRRWAVTISLIIIAVLVCQGFFIASIRAIQISGVSILSLGFGETHASAIISGWSIQNIKDPARQILAAIFVANMPQAILSLLYFNLNGLLTTMWTASEWSDFATERKTLRVSTPEGKQRSSHFLQLPYKVAVPLMIISGLLHWLVSQSIFLAVLAVYNQDGTLNNPVAIASCGFSPIAIICVVIWGVLLVIAAVVIGHRKLNTTIPIVGSCSIAISAACHRPDWDVDAGTSAVQWGVVPGMKTDRGVGHCCFTSGDVEPVERGHLYAGNG